MKLRVKFRKYGPVRFIGHLDVMRYFQKCIRRAGIDITYTTGFSPHQIMSFAAPLSVGLESNGEYMDIEVNSVTSSEDMLRRFQEAGVYGIEVISVKKLPEGAGNAMASVAAASYTVRFRDTFSPQSLCPEFDLKTEIQTLLSRSSILITKETKKNTIEVDLKPGIYECSTDGHSVFLLLDASSSGNIKPGKVIEVLLAQKGITLSENALLITREETFMNVGSAERPEFVPLDAIGEEINAGTQ